MLKTTKTQAFLKQEFEHDNNPKDNKRASVDSAYVEPKLKEARKSPVIVAKVEEVIDLKEYVSPNIYRKSMLSNKDKDYGDVLDSSKVNHESIKSMQEIKLSQSPTVSTNKKGYSPVINTMRENTVAEAKMDNEGIDEVPKASSNKKGCCAWLASKFKGK